jgi:hypothetical protein
MNTNKINLNNYEAYLLDFLEGNLNDTTDQEMLFAFLKEYPELNALLETPIDKLNYFETDNFQDVYLYSENLKQNKPSPEYERLFFLAMENELTAEEYKQLDSEINSDPILARHYKYWINTKLIPNQTLALSHQYKSKLKHGRKLYPAFMALATAAVGLYAFLYFGITEPVPNAPNQTIAQQNNVVGPIAHVDNNTPNTAEENSTNNIASISSFNQGNNRPIRKTKSENKPDNYPNVDLQAKKSGNLTFNNPDDSSKPNSDQNTPENQKVNQPALLKINAVGISPESMFISEMPQVSTKPIIATASTKTNSKNNLLTMLNNRINDFFHIKADAEMKAGAILGAIDQEGLIGLNAEKGQNGRIQALTFRLANKTWKQEL